MCCGKISSSELRVFIVASSSNRRVQYKRSQNYASITFLLPIQSSSRYGKRRVNNQLFTNKTPSINFNIIRSTERISCKLHSALTSVFRAFSNLALHSVVHMDCSLNYYSELVYKKQYIKVLRLPKGL